MDATAFAMLFLVAGMTWTIGKAIYRHNLMLKHPEAYDRLKAEERDKRRKVATGAVFVLRHFLKK